MTDKQPIYILPENVERTTGRDAQRNNIFAIKLVADSIKTTLGPKGMDKMLVDSTGRVVVTNDGVTILEEMEIEHPAAKMMVDIAKTQENEVGDGTTTVVMLAGKLLENAEKLLDKKIHPTIIIKGYKLAAKKSEKLLYELSKDVNENRKEILKNIAMTAMTGKGAETEKDLLSNLIIDSIVQIGDESEGKINVNIDDIKITKLKGKGIEESQLLKGILLDKKKVSVDMPSCVQNAKIALVDFAIEVKNPETEAKISISNPEQLQGFIEREEKMIKQITEKIFSVGANVILCQKGIDDLAQYYLAKKGVYACRRIERSEMERIAKATGGHIVSSLNDLNEKELGKAGIVEEIQEGEEKLTLIDDCENPKAVTILIRGGTDHVLDEIERAVKDGIGVIYSVLKSNRVVGGAGAVEIEIARRLRDYGKSLMGKEQLAINEFANALESIPETLAENAGLDPIDILTELKAKHEAGEIFSGINILSNKIENSFEAGIIEPLKIKKQAISSASEVSMMILRIDDVLAANPKNSKKQSPNFSGVEY